MTINENILLKGEILGLNLRELFMKNGYLPFRMGKFEEYDFYARNKDFLVSDNVITFTDTDGKLLALKPDVTLSIIKNTTDAPDVIRKVFYSENVYRVSRGSGSFKEINQTGVECIGAVKNDTVCDVLTLASDSLKLLSESGILVISDLDILSELISEITESKKDAETLYSAVSEKNIELIKKLYPSTPGAETLVSLLKVHGPVKKTYPEIKKTLGFLEGKDFYEEFCRITEKLASLSCADKVCIDFSITDDINYYNGIVFKGFVKNVPNAVLSGGQYDRLMKRMKKKSSAVGFAVYTEELERVGEADKTDNFVNIALPKGRLGEKIYKLFAKAGYECDSLLEPNRKLVFENPEKGIRYFWVKPSDVPIYVERGAADIGVAGKDILLEYNPDVYELTDLKTGICRMAVAAPKNFVDDSSTTLRVATKFSKIASEYYQSKGRNIDIIHLNGSIELAPILGLSDVIVDIVETGATLRENNLEVKEEILPISARLIANKSSFRYKSTLIDELVVQIREEIE